MLYELRTYEMVPGKMPDINNRFANVTTKLFEKHGIRVVGFWTPLVGTSNQLIYMLAWDSLAEREKKWDAFQSDPAWISARAASEEAGPIVARAINSILMPTPYSPMK
ncbi:MAG: NIPSNAP family protein [Chloroflexi bacterium]|nr:NIPSNAP family protein [Chloroflexota bacterium]MCL5026628.1 NIPSNAP family protein [Chloroflexota bacterium]